jgi:hypothetical protein
MEIEIVKPLPLDEQQAVLLDLHSFLNILNVFAGELYLITMQAGDARAMETVTGKVEEVIGRMGAGKFDGELAWELKLAEELFRADLQQLFGQQPELRENPCVKESVGNIQSVMKVMHLRLGEFLAWVNNPEQWIAHDMARVHRNLTEFFAAIERNSKGRYRLVRNVAEQDSRDYLVNLQIDSVDSASLVMPAVVKDVFQDLFANARKYTSPGGCINAGIYSNDRELRLVVEDTGCGIPQDEMDKVVEFGYRASNCREHKTHGGGFGLTKACWVTRKFGGRMWLRSELGRGTRVTIHIPMPGAEITRF